ncbi:MAG TPA: hypothetical protein VIW24_05600 [Aldersonia sp.]
MREADSPGTGLGEQARGHRWFQVVEQLFFHVDPTTGGSIVRITHSDKNFEIDIATEHGRPAQRVPSSSRQPGDASAQYISNTGRNGCLGRSDAFRGYQSRKLLDEKWIASCSVRDQVERVRRQRR